MLIPTVPMEKFKEFGFKRCKGSYGDAGLYYLCVVRGASVIFVSENEFWVESWDRDDERIHEKPNCKRRDTRDWCDILYDLVQLGMLRKE